MGVMTTKDLLETTGWVLLQYNDGSEFAFETTLNKDLLSSLADVTDKPGHMLNINTGDWVELPIRSVASATLTKERPEQNEVNKFANKFIR